MALGRGTIEICADRELLMFSKVGVSDRYELASLGLRHSGNESADRAYADEVRVETGFAPLEAVYIHRDMLPPRPN
jgi:hypothetical protein